MSIEFIHEQPWQRLQAAAQQCRYAAYVAVAYFGKGAATLCPLPERSRLVVNASERAVKQGLTHPADLLKLQRQGVRIFSVQNLHAKVYVFGQTAYIGSANASQHSAATLQEVMLRTTDRETVKDAREFVRGLCLEELGPEELKRLQKLYRPPKQGGGGRRNGTKARRNGSVKPAYSTLRIAKLIRGYYPEGSEATYEEGKRAAQRKRRHRNTHELEEFRWNNRSFRAGESVVQVIKEGNGVRFVSPPGQIINTKVWSNGRQRCTFVFLEVPKRRRKRVDKLAKALGRGAKKRLLRGGTVNQDFAEKLRRAWQH